MIAYAAFILSLISLAWQVRTHYLTGPRVRVRIASSTFLPNLKECVAVEAINVGRMGVTVRGIALEIDSSGRHAPIDMSRIYPPGSDELPVRCEPQESVQWHIPRSLIDRVAADVQPRGRGLRLYLTLSNGRRVYYRDRLRRAAITR